MGTELPTKVMLGQTLVLTQMTFLNNVGKVGRLVLSGTSCIRTHRLIVSLCTRICPDHSFYKLTDICETLYEHPAIEGFLPQL
jgi:hypothetical protein